jgi:hypothetical protein
LQFARRRVANGFQFGKGQLPTPYRVQFLAPDVAPRIHRKAGGFRQNAPNQLKQVQILVDRVRGPLCPFKVRDKIPRILVGYVPHKGEGGLALAGPIFEGGKLQLILVHRGRACVRAVFGVAVLNPSVGNPQSGVGGIFKCGGLRLCRVQLSGDVRQTVGGIPRGKGFKKFLGLRLCLALVRFPGRQPYPLAPSCQGVPL